MNYRHAFHAGSHADVLKHLTLVYCLDALKRKDAPFAVLDTHAGAGLYDLGSAEAERSPEWKDGIAKLWDWPDSPAPIAAYLRAVRSFNTDGALSIYPGSPALIAGALRAEDVLIACEKHPKETQFLRQRLARLGNVHLHERDAWEGLGALLPLPRPRGLVLIDPPYEEPGELERSADAIGAAVKRFRRGMYLWWRPLKSESALARVDDELRTQLMDAGAIETLRADLWVDAAKLAGKLTGKLTGSSLFLINPPFGLEAALREALPALVARLTQGQAGWRVTTGASSKK